MKGHLPPAEYTNGRGRSTRRELTTFPYTSLDQFERGDGIITGGHRAAERYCGTKLHPEFGGFECEYSTPFRSARR
jgi:hypothetical protein